MPCWDELLRPQVHDAVVHLRLGEGEVRFDSRCHELIACLRLGSGDQVKDATPAGYTDTGSTWSKKDAMPTGYTDNGSAWVQTTAKVAKIVPA